MNGDPMSFQCSIRAMQILRSEATGRVAVRYGADSRHLVADWTKTPDGAGRCEEPLRRHDF
jgi:hypothetical protein